VTSQGTSPIVVHGECQLVRNITSGETIRRPAAHMRVKSWQAEQ
jgi:hypothetical protein